MKLFAILSLMIVATATLSACKTTADTRKDVYSVDLDGNDQYRGNGNFCPPGHAKKGWC